MTNGYQTHQTLILLITMSGELCLNATRHFTHTHTTVNGLLSGTTRVGLYQKKHSPTHTHPDHRTFFSSSSIYNDPWHPLCSVYELDSPLGQPLSRSSLVFLGLGPSTSYSMHFFTQSSSYFRSTCPYQRSLFCCSTNAMSLVSLSAPYLGVCLLT